MTLFESNPQYREKLTIWRVLSLLPLYGSLAGGRIWGWFAVNIPMDFEPEIGEKYTGDIDIIARLSNFPISQEWIYRTWEVKVSLLHKDGMASSLKAGKVKKTITQLAAYRQFGAPEITLLDIYICENGFMRNNPFPPKVLTDVIKKKRTELGLEGFGYQLLPFEHGEKQGEDLGLIAMPSRTNMMQTTLNILPSNNFGLRQPFFRLVESITNFNKQQREKERTNSNRITIYCKRCRKFQLIDMRNEQNCPNCNDDLVAQT
jgi:hypothetical protein